MIKNRNLLKKIFIPLAILLVSGFLVLFLTLDKYDDDNILAVYKVQDGTMELYDLPLVNEEYRVLQEKTDKHELIWEMIREALPEDILQWIHYFKIFTDGEGEDLAYIVIMDDNNEVFALGFDIMDIFTPEGALDYDLFEENLLHEVDHLITLNSGQLRSIYYEDSNPATYYVADFGDSREDSYLNLFFQEFWSDIYEELEQHERFYLRYQDHFVSEYAATDPTEDIAETFWKFVVESTPAGETIAEEKILFFYRFPELVDLREQLRANL